METNKENEYESGTSGATMKTKQDGRRIPLRTINQTQSNPITAITTWLGWTAAEPESNPTPGCSGSSSPDICRKSYMKCLNKHYANDIIKYLLTAERTPLGVPTIDNSERASVINWLMELNAPSANPAVLQSACWFLSSVLGTKSHRFDEKVVTIGAACFRIAQKLHNRRVMPAKCLVFCARNRFSKERLLATERKVLIELGFPSQPVTPHEYIAYLAWWCDSSQPEELDVAATFLCMSGLLVAKEIGAEYPSVIAAAAVTNAILLLRNDTMMKELRCCPIYKAAERKATDLSHTCTLIREAVLTMADPFYQYKAPLKIYGVPPNSVAQVIINAVHQYEATSSF